MKLDMWNPHEDYMHTIVHVPNEEKNETLLKSSKSPFSMCA